MGWRGLDWGNVPAWVGSILTGTSLMIASLTYRRSVKEKEREQTDRERGQASKVTTWLGHGRDDAWVENSNDVAVSVQIFMRRGDEIDSSDVIGLGPNEKRSYALAPHAYYEYRASVGARGDTLPPPSLMIVDSSGRCWLRDEVGQLTALDETARARLEAELRHRAGYISVNPY
jgi:hypothetical protein